MIRRVTGWGYESYYLLGFGDPVPQGYEIVDTGEAARKLRWGTDDYFGRQAMRSALCDRGIRDVYRLDDHGVVGMIEALLHSGSVRLAAKIRPRFAAMYIPGASRPEPDLPAATPDPRYGVHLVRRYHDDGPVQMAEYELELESGEIVKGRLIGDGEAKIEGLASPPTRVRYGPDDRDYGRKDQRQNSEYTESFDADTFVGARLG
jgi:hypothetical protein